MRDFNLFSGIFGFAVAVVLALKLIFWPLVVQQRQAGPCVVHACEICAKHSHCKILFIRYREIAMGHAVSIYKENDQLFAEDWRGPVVLDTPDMFDDAESIAIWLTVIDPPLPNLTVRSAAFEWQR